MYFGMGNIFMCIVLTRTLNDSFVYVNTKQPFGTSASKSKSKCKCYNEKKCNTDDKELSLKELINEFIES